jgi:hypothetical protein
MKSSCIPFLASILLIACGDPCLPTVFADTSIIAADEDCVPDGTSTSTGDDTGASESATSGADECNADIDCPEGQVCDLSVVDHVCLPTPPQNPLTCVAVPEAGKFWGPCLNGTCVEGACEESAGTSICVPGCTEDPCNLGVCFPGVCNDKWQCIAPCDGPEDCAPGMVCNDAGHCAWAGE